TRVYFGVCGIGLGHAGRCIPIADRLRELNAEILFSTYKDAVEYIRGKGYPVVEPPSMDVMVKPDGTIDFRQTIVNPGPFLAAFIFTKQVETEIRFIKAFNPDVVISDSRVSPIIAAKFLNIPSVCIVNQFKIIIPRRKRLLRLAKITETGGLAIIGKIWVSGSTPLLIPDFPPPYTISVENLKMPMKYYKRVKFIGPILPIYPEELPSKEEIREKLGLDPEKPLIFAPISGPLKERAYIIDVLKEIFKNFPEKYQVVMSTGSPSNPIQVTKYGHNFVVYSWIPNRFEYLKASDLVISRAGHGTLTQNIYYGKPMVLIPTPSHTEQMNNAIRVREMGIGEVIEQSEVSVETLIKAIDKILSDDAYRRRIEEIRSKIAKINGLKTAVEIILDILEKKGIN
ncbi:MAG: glycosyltransferase, partial [Candidatus Bathyarchaeia archaeon]